MVQTNQVDVAGAVVVATVDFHQATIYRILQDRAGHPERISADDPRGLARNVYHRHGNPGGTYEADTDAFWREIGHALSPAAEILLLGEGKGKANASHHLVGWLEKHMSDVAAKVVADVRVDLSALTEQEVLRQAQHFFGLVPVRDHADSRRGQV